MKTNGLKALSSGIASLLRASQARPCYDLVHVKSAARSTLHSPTRLIIGRWDAGDLLARRRAGTNRIVSASLRLRLVLRSAETLASFAPAWKLSRS